MPRVLIGICTMNRPAGLQSALDGLAGQRLKILADGDVAVAIIDNSADGNAEECIASLQPSFRFALNYRHVPERGLAMARNAAIAAALERGATHLGFIDDDECPAPDWLENIMQVVTTTGAGAAVGPVLPLFAAPPPLWLPVDAFATRAICDGDHVRSGYTGNCVIACAPMGESRLRFDPRLNSSGGEDTAFFRALQAAGHHIAWAERAEVWETVPADRMQARWLLWRWYRTGLVEARLADFAAPSARTAVRNLGKGVLRLAGGAASIAAAALLPRRPRSEAMLGSCFTFCRGAGYVAGALGLTRNEYARHDGRDMAGMPSAAPVALHATWPAVAGRRASRETGSDHPNG